MVLFSGWLQSAVIDLTECGTPGLVMSIRSAACRARQRCLVAIALRFRVTASQFRELIDGVDDLYVESTQNRCSCYLFVASVCGRTRVDLGQGSSDDDAGISRRLKIAIDQSDVASSSRPARS